jgi:hypothetical protein
MKRLIRARVDQIKSGLGNPICHSGEMFNLKAPNLKDSVFWFEPNYVLVYNFK